MALKSIEINRASVRRIWEKSGRSEFWLELRTDRATLADRDAFDAFIDALNEVNAIHEDREGGETSFVTIAPKGFVFFSKGVHSEPVLDEWLASLAEHFTVHELHGTLRGASKATVPVWHDRSHWDREQAAFVSHAPASTGFISWVIDLDNYAAEHRRGRNGGWHVDPSATDRICRHLADWATPGGPNIQITRSLFAFEITDPDVVPAILADSVLLQGRANLFRYQPRREHGYLADLAPRGQTCAQIIDPERPWSAIIDEIRDAITAFPELTNQAFIRPGPRSPGSWMDIDIIQDLPGQLPEVAIRAHPDLLDRYVPDAHGIQVLRDTHLDNARDLSRWNITDLGHGRHLVEAPDLTPWYSTPLPDPNIVEQARHDFGAMILTEATIQQNLPDWWNGPRPPHYPPTNRHRPT